MVRYVIYRSTASDFSPTPEDSIGCAPETTYTDVGVAGTVSTNYYYVLRAVSDSGQKFDPSNAVGEFDKDLINEAPK